MADGTRPRRLGHIKVEGKDYTVAESDVIVVRFSV